MAKKRKPSEAELVNDASLRWNDYKWGEVLEVDGKRLRFVARDGEQVELATLDGIAPAGSFPMLSVRRPAFAAVPATQEDKASMAAGAAARHGSRNNK